MQDKLTGQTDLTEQTNRLAQAVSDKKAAQAALSAEKDGALRSVEDLKGLQADMVSDRAERDELAQRYRQANEKAAAEMAQHQASLTEHNRRTDTLRQKLEQLAQAKRLVAAKAGPDAATAASATTRCSTPCKPMPSSSRSWTAAAWRRARYWKSSGSATS